MFQIKDMVNVEIDLSEKSGIGGMLTCLLMGHSIILRFMGDDWTTNNLAMNLHSMLVNVNDY